MDIVYLFFEQHHIRIPFYNYDKNLFSALFNSRLGRWEHTAR
jgi:hypothetical protein